MVAQGTAAKHAGWGLGYPLCSSAVAHNPSSASIY